MTVRARVVHRVASLLERPLQVGHEFTPLEAIIVLGAALRRGELSRLGRERVDGALALWRRGGAPLLCVTGGATGETSRTEADAMAAALRAGGVPEESIIMEPTATSTHANAHASAALLLPRGIRRVWLVTQPFHGRRAQRLFSQAGFEPSVWHLDDSVQYRRRGRAVRWLGREYGAWVRGLFRT